MSGRLVGRTGKTIMETWDRLIIWRDLVKMRTDIDLPTLPPFGAPTTFLPAPEIVERLRLW